MVIIFIILNFIYRGKFLFLIYYNKIGLITTFMYSDEAFFSEPKRSYKANARGFSN